MEAKMSSMSAVLKALADRVSTAEKDFTPAAAVVGQIGVAVATKSQSQLREMLAGIAVVRERLESRKGPYEHRPLDALRDADSVAFLAGALWACAEITQARIDVHARHEESQQTTGDRAAVRQLVRELLESADTVTPADVTRAGEAQDLNVRADVVSKALGDLLRDGDIAEVHVDGDRRRRHFARTPVAARA